MVWSGFLWQKLGSCIRAAFLADCVDDEACVSHGEAHRDELCACVWYDWNASIARRLGDERLLAIC